MSILVGIQESVVVVESVVNEKNSLEITLKQGGDVDLFAAMNAGSSIEENTQKLLYFPVDNKYYGETATHQQMVQKFRQLTAKLGHLISNQVAEVKWNMWEGTGINSADDIASKITQESVIEKITTNIFNQFVEMVKSSDTSKKSRVKFVRQSQAKHFATLPEYLNFKKDGGEWTTSFVESMGIPKEQSKLAYTKKELEKGLDSAVPVSSDSPASGTSDLPFEI